MLKSFLLSKLTLIGCLVSSPLYAEPNTDSRYSNTLQTAKPLSLDKLTSGNIEKAKEVNYFRLNLKKSGILTLESSGSTDTKATLFDKNGQKILVADAGGEAQNFKLSYQATPSLYYLAIKHAKASGTGAYQLKASLQIPTNSANLIFPFTAGQSWTVCQGYNTPEITHIGPLANSLDLSLASDSVSAGAYGCIGSSNASTGQNVLAPQAGTVAWISPFTSDLVCISLNIPAANGAKSVLLGHFTPLTTLARGSVVKQGDILGLVNPASTKNGQYGHIHISMHSTASCLSSG
ncbi:MAG TPA: hypothetical protein PLM98_16560, partial [Thiolinea sp.]|nr:hypothetical protein [Thiolinea sp.]